MLDDVRSERAYRLAATVISFGHAMRMSSRILNAFGPMMRAESMRRKMNVGLATADRSMMVLSELVCFNPRVALRNVVAGQQVPMELTSLGRAYLAGITEQERANCLRPSSGAVPAQRRTCSPRCKGRSDPSSAMVIAPPRGSAAFWLLRYQSSSRGCRSTRSI